MFGLYMRTRISKVNNSTLHAKAAAWPPQINTGFASFQCPCQSSPPLFCGVFIDVGRGGAIPPKMFIVFCHFVLCKAVSQTKYCSSLEIKHPPEFFWPPKKIWAG